ncbi:RecX family transcriptional regulator [Photobacterium kishitanii]|uniref:Regulatory protein RecX n=1 Tax=Photobacterium kishitanii TaxID=318456 RepID=A0A2T3KIK5_9GAMM|nr:RecX family transcriptional regulator [Photobacterium kishitanii]KJG59681.1 RecX family transcriptional regulator [Photobacterium kishitanii]KJG62971.1 RecX family transcriptional regulator [Photobacterium kishitanii]KJG68018.1 RecX family transcriptional regulator [Photobacterium kishitanii]KJG71147.1 RecX family transcriptional regulator [Photobacterium kishitanii]OBU28875.1 RecX family transcriptional regulator [Photobacterium kishitanii]
MKKPYPAKTIQNVINSAIYHLNLRDHSEYELRKKLEAKTEQQDWIETVLQQMKDFGYLKDDLPFALHFSERAFSNEYGQQYIKQKLKTKGIPESIIEEALAEVIEKKQVIELAMISDRLNSYDDFSQTTKDKITNDLTKRGFSFQDISTAIAEHAAADTLLSKAKIKGMNADLTTEVLKLVRKLKGRTVIKQELKMKHVDITDLEQVLDELTDAGDIDFYENCQLVLAKKRFDLSNFKDKSKAYAYLSSKGYSQDEIKEAMAAAI